MPSVDAQVSLCPPKRAAVASSVPIAQTLLIQKVCPAACDISAPVAIMLVLHQTFELLRATSYGFMLKQLWQCFASSFL
jgi:hypothetical protein